MLDKWENPIELLPRFSYNLREVNNRGRVTHYRLKEKERPWLKASTELGVGEVTAGYC